MRAPAVFLFDEPLSNLDAKLRMAMRSELIKLHHRLDTTMIYVTHDQTEAMTMGDRIVVMNEGRIQQVGAPLEVYDDPGNIFVAGFIGSPTMNLLSGTVERRDDALTFRSDGLSLDLPSAHVAGRGGAVTIGIRPESLNLDRKPEAVELASKIEVVEHLGADTILGLSTAGPSLTAKLPRNDQVCHGDSVPLWINPDKILAFDGATGERLRA